MMRSRMIFSSALLLFGCKEDAAIYKTVAVPAFVQQMIDADFPADGAIHVQSRRKFTITENTYFCTYRRGFGIGGIDDALERMGQKSRYRGEGIAGENPTPECVEGAAGDRIFVAGNKTMNRNGKPYKLVIAVWQGDTIWIAKLERIGSLHPKAMGLADDVTGKEAESPESDSIVRDFRDINEPALSAIFGF